MLRPQQSARQERPNLQPHISYRLRSAQFKEFSIIQAFVVEFATCASKVEIIRGLLPSPMGVTVIGNYLIVTEKVAPPDGRDRPVGSPAKE